MRNLFDILKEKFSKFYSPSEHLAIDEVIVKFKGHVIFRQYIPKKHKCFGIKIYKLCDETEYTYDMTVYLGRDRQRTASTAYCNPRERRYKDVATNCTWTITSRPQTYSMTWPQSKFTVVALSDPQQEGHATGLKPQENDTQTG